MAAFFLFMSSSSCLAMAFLWADGDDDDDDDEEEEEVPFSGKEDFRRFLAGGGAPEVDSVKCWMTPSHMCKFRTKIECQPGISDL